MLYFVVELFVRSGAGEVTYYLRYSRLQAALGEPDALCQHQRTARC